MPDGEGRAVELAAEAGAAAHTFTDVLADRVSIDGDDGHHLARVRRIEVGEALTLADGQGTWRPYAVDAVGRGEVQVVATGGPRTEPRFVPRLCVAFALTKGQKPETVVRQLSELGVDEITPVLTARSVVRVRGDRARELVVRLGRVAREAACQARRARIASIGAPCGLAEALAAAGDGLVVAERAETTGGADDAPAPGPDGWTLLVGPEGGFDPSEAEGLAEAPRVAVGPFVLRAETAAVAAAAVLTARRRAATPGDRQGPTDAY